MPFVKKEWKDRLVEFAGRRRLTDVNTGVSTLFDVARAEGQVPQAGDAFSSANMNDLETRIGDAIDGNETKITGLSSNITKVSDELTKTRMPNSVKIITSGSGASTKYYLQLGADTASKKLLGETTVALASSTSANSVSGTVSKTYTATQAGKVIAVVMAVTGNDTHAVYYGPSVVASATSGSKVANLKSLTAIGYNSNLSASSGDAVVGCFLGTMAAKGVLTVKITPYEPQFQTGYAVMFITV